jgi:hypothetical protein
MEHRWLPGLSRADQERVGRRGRHDPSRCGQRFRHTGGGDQRLSKVLIVRRKLRQIPEVEIDHLHRKNTIL